MPASEYILHLREKIGHDLIMMPSAAAVIRNEENEILLHQRADNGQWSLPGGALEPGEEAAQTVIREVFEETGLEVRPLGLVGIYSGSDSIFTYPNGDQVGVVSITFECKIIGGELSTDNDESLALKYFPFEALPKTLTPHHLKRIQHAYNRTEPYLGLE